MIPNGVETEVFMPQQLQNRQPEFKDKLVIGFVGFCREWHQLDQVLARLAAMPHDNLHFLVVGDGPVIADLKQQAIELNFQNKFTSTGLVSRNEMPFWLDQIDIALQPAVTPWASPLKMLEYLAKGLAIVAPDSANIKELLADKDNALLFAEDNSADMVDCIETLIRNDELRSKLKARAIETIAVKGLTWSNNADNILEWFANRNSRH